MRTACWLARLTDQIGHNVHCKKASSVRPQDIMHTAGEWSQEVEMAGGSHHGHGGEDRPALLRAAINNSNGSEERYVPRER